MRGELEDMCLDRASPVICTLHGTLYHRKSVASQHPTWTVEDPRSDKRVTALKELSLISVGGRTWWPRDRDIPWVDECLGPLAEGRTEATDLADLGDSGRPFPRADER